MLNETIQCLRRQKGLTQQQLADQLHVVRQTVSKWEKGLSVPDAAQLQQLADALDTRVEVLLDCPAPETEATARALAQISAQLAIRNQRAHRIGTVLWVLLAVMLAFVLGSLVLSAAGAVIFSQVSTTTSVAALS